MENAPQISADVFRIEEKLTSALADLDSLDMAMTAARLQDVLDTLHAEWAKKASSANDQ